MTLEYDAREDLYGTWRLLDFAKRFVDTGERLDAFGKEPRGFLSYGRDGRMSAILVRSGRPKPDDPDNLSREQTVELFETMYAYAGTFSFDGKTAVHRVDISWNESWTGTDQLRHIRLEGDKLLISTDPEPDITVGRSIVWELVWQKVRP